MADIELGSRTVALIEPLDKTFGKTSALDLLLMLRLTAAGLIKEQIDIGNPPTNLIIDGSGKGKTIDQAQKRVQAFFADKTALRAAVYEAWDRIQSLTRVRTGRAAGAYELWFKDRRVGKSPAACEIYLERMNPATDFFRIVGPVLVYGRKIYWNPKGKAKFKRKTIYKTKSVIVKGKSIRGIMDQVEQSLRRKYRYLAITEDWVKTSALPKDGKTPGIYIGFKRRGSLLARRK